MRTRILIVEDDPQEQARLSTLLKCHGYYSETAADGLEAVQRARLAWFDIVLMTYEIAELDGAAAARLITDLTSDHGSPKVIAVTRDEARMLARVPDAGTTFHAIASKPLDHAALLETIMRLQDGDRDCPAAPAKPASRFPPYVGNGRFRPSDRRGRGAGQVRKPPGGPGRRVLLADDDDALREVLSALLAEQGFEVEPVANGFDALLMMGSAAYDVAILDYEMPKMNGVATARLVHDLIDRADRPRLVALTANPARVSARDDGLLKLFDTILAKSGDFGPVISSVGSYCHGGKGKTLLF